MNMKVLSFVIIASVMGFMLYLLYSVRSYNQNLSNVEQKNLFEISSLKSEISAQQQIIKKLRENGRNYQASNNERERNLISCKQKVVDLESGKEILEQDLMKVKSDYKALSEHPKDDKEKADKIIELQSKYDELNRQYVKLVQSYKALSGRNEEKVYEKSDGRNKYKSDKNDDKSDEQNNKPKVESLVASGDTKKDSFDSQKNKASSFPEDSQQINNNNHAHNQIHPPADNKKIESQLKDLNHKGVNDDLSHHKGVNSNQDSQAGAVMNQNRDTNAKGIEPNISAGDDTNKYKVLKPHEQRQVNDRQNKVDDRRNPKILMANDRYKQ